MSDNSLIERLLSGLPDFLDTLLKYCGFAALGGLIPGFFGFFICGLAGAMGAGKALFGLSHWHWYQGLAAGCLFGLLGPVIISVATAFFVACSVEIRFCFTKRS